MIYVDPGVHGSGVAYFETGALVSAEYRHAPLFARESCVCEIPQIYPHGAKAGRRVDPQDLIALAVAAGRMTGQVPTRYVLPAEWKGQVPKDVQHARMWKALSPAEQVILRAVVPCRTPKSARPSLSLLHNVYDAVCLGLKMEGRL